MRAAPRCCATRCGSGSARAPARFARFGQISVEPRPYQLVPLLMALRQDPVRLLIADDVGIGKTIEAALIAARAARPGRARSGSRCCARRTWPSNGRPSCATSSTSTPSWCSPRPHAGWSAASGSASRCSSVYDNVIVSTDFIKAERHRDEFIRACPELVIVDEAHGFALGERPRPPAPPRAAHQARRRTQTGTSSSSPPPRTAATRTRSGPCSACSTRRSTDLPDDLSGEHNERDRRTARAPSRPAPPRRHPRTTSTPTPRSPSASRPTPPTQLTPEYRRLFDKAVNFARERRASEAEGDSRRQRVHWWSALGAAALARLEPGRRGRDAAQPGGQRRRPHRRGGRRARPPRRARPGRRRGRREPGRRAGRALPSDTERRPPARCGRHLVPRARAGAAALAGEHDPKLQAAIKLVDELLADGHNPIVFCRFIPTAEYVAEHLASSCSSAKDRRGRCRDRHASPPPSARSASPSSRRTTGGCWSRPTASPRAINLQEDFDAVVHYDLSWNPTRHEQREGRVDRYGQPEPTVRVVTFYGANSPIDGIVLDVLLRKHQRDPQSRSASPSRSRPTPRR